MEKKNDPPDGRVNSGQQTRRVTGDIRIAGEVKADLPQEITREYVSSSHKEQTREDYRFIVECVTLFFVILVAGFNLAQLYMSKSQFASDERPYLLVHKVSPIHMVVGDPMMADVEWLNFGKTPAVNEKNISRVVFGRDAAALADQFFIKIVPDESVPVTSSSEAVIAQGAHGCDADEKTGNSNFDCGFTTSVSDSTVGNAIDIMDATTNDNHVFIVGRIYYRDTSGRKYSTDYCFKRFKTGVLAFCPTHNDVK